MTATRTRKGAADEAAPRRLSLSTIVELLLTRGSHDRSSVSLTRNAKGDTQIDVVVRTGDESGVSTVQDALAVASDVYDTLRAKYPIATQDGATSGTSSTARKGKA